MELWKRWHDNYLLVILTTLRLLHNKLAHALPAWLSRYYHHWAQHRLHSVSRTQLSPSFASGTSIIRIRIPGDILCKEGNTYAFTWCVISMWNMSPKLKYPCAKVNSIGLPSYTISLHYSLYCILWHDPEYPSKTGNACDISVGSLSCIHPHNKQVSRVHLGPTCPKKQELKSSSPLHHRHATTHHSICMSRIENYREEK